MLALALLPCPAFDPPQEVADVQEIALSAAAEGEGSEGALKLEIARDCTLHVSVEVAGPSSRLAIEDPGGTLLAEERGEQVAALYAVLDCEAGRSLVIRVRQAPPPGTTSIPCRLRQNPLSGQARDFAATAADELGTIAELAASGDREEARAWLEILAEELVRQEPSAATDGLLVRASRSASELGMTSACTELRKRLLALRDESRPDRHLDRALARDLLAKAYLDQRDAARAKDLQLESIALLERVLPAGDERLWKARQDVAEALAKNGELEKARDLFESVRDSLLATRPADDPAVLKVQVNLASMATQLGDYPRARETYELVLPLLKATRPENDATLLSARQNQALLLEELGDPAAALEIEEDLIRIQGAFLPPGHPALVDLRLNHFGALTELHEYDRARAEGEALLAELEVDPHASARQLQQVRHNLSLVYTRVAESERALQLLEDTRSTVEQTLPPEHPDALQFFSNLVTTHLRRGDRAAAERATHELCTRLEGALRQAILSASPREAEARVAELGHHLSIVLSVALGSGRYEPDPAVRARAFALVELARRTSLAASWLRSAAGDDEETRAQLERASNAADALARCVLEHAPPAELARARETRDAAQRALLDRSRGEHGALEALLVSTPESARAVLAPDEALIAVWTAQIWSLIGDGRKFSGLDTLLAFVLRPGGELELLDLGPLSPIEEAAQDWRRALMQGTEAAARGIGVEASTKPGEQPAQAGRKIEELVIQPLARMLAGATRWVVEPDGPLHVLPLDAAPLGEGLLGERVRIELCTSWVERLRRRNDGEGELVLLGGVDYGQVKDAEQDASGSALELGAGFVPLPGSSAEVREIAALAARAGVTTTDGSLLLGSSADWSSLRARASHARFLHLATHGWILPDAELEGVPRPEGSRGESWGRLLRDAQGAELTPLTLCGLALAGANTGGGLVTAEQLATLDLEHCALAVVSACDTSVGIRRAGQGVASIQKALHMAGARSVVTSLWKVSDTATKTLMVEFYRRLWLEHRDPASALWEAKTALRGQGAPARDWAGWVLTGNGASTR